ncbi:MAG: hypothetical protein WB621_19625 [Candidatus Acidiferrales bacterium]
MDKETKWKILRAAQAEIRRHQWDTFVDDPPSVAQGGNGVVVTGCVACRQQLGTKTQDVDHLADDVMPAILRAAFKAAGQPTLS